MPGPTTSWNLVRVYGTWRGMDGTLKAGTYRVTLPVRVTNSTDDAIIPAGQFATGPLQTANSGAPSLDVQVPSTNDPDIEQTGWSVTVAITFTDGATPETYVISVPYAARPVVDGGTGLGVNLRTVALSASIPQSDPLYKVGVAGGLAKLNDSGQVIDASGTVVSGGGGGLTDGSVTNIKVASNAAISLDKTADSATRLALTSAERTKLTALSGTNTGDQTLPTWTTISGKPAVVAEGASQAAARTAIGAGTSSLVVGTTASDAKAGNYQPTAANISDSTATGRSVLTATDAAAARTAIGAGTGTSNLALGTTSSTAKAGDYAPTLADVPAGSILVAPLDGSTNTSAGMARPSARTNIFFRWRSTVQPTNMITGDEWLQVP